MGEGLIVLLQLPLSVTLATPYELNKKQDTTMNELHQQVHLPTGRPSLLMSKSILEFEEY
jgi:hypothetical protein